MRAQAKPEQKIYESCRHQLADVGRRFFQAANRYPDVCFQFLDGDHEIRGKWREWIVLNRTTDDESCEQWDIYPASWLEQRLPSEIKARSDFEWQINRLKDLEGEESKNCGLYRSVTGNLDAARHELTQLAESGMQVLKAINTEVIRMGGIPKVAPPSGAIVGYRGWLDTVRNTAEVSQSAYLKVSMEIYGVEKDLLSQVEYIGKHIRENTRAIDLGQPRPNCVSAAVISPNIFEACGNAIRLWLQAEPPTQIQNVVCPDLEVINLPATVSREKDMALASLGVQYELPGANEKPRRKKPQGKPAASPAMQADDLRIFTAWKRSGERKLKVFAEKNGMSEKTARRIIDRHRQRVNRSGAQKRKTVH